MAEGSWRDKAPAQAFGLDQELWAQVRALHAQWQVREPQLKIAQTSERLIRYGLKCAREIEMEVYGEHKGQ